MRKTERWKRKLKSCLIYNFRQLDTSEMTARISFLAAVHTLCVNDILIYDFCYFASNIIYPPYPLRWILCFKLFSNTFLLGVLLYQPKKERLCFFLYIGKMRTKCTGSEQVAVQDFMMLLYTVCGAVPTRRWDGG